MSTENEREIQRARVDRAVAEDVAVGMAAKAGAEEIRADAEGARADALAAENVRRSVELSRARGQRDAALAGGMRAREEARSSAFAFWLLLGVVAVALAVWAFWSAARPDQTASTTTVIQREAPAPRPAAPPTVPVQVQAPAQPAAPPPPVVVERQVPVAVPVPVERPAPQPTKTIIVQPPPPRAEAPAVEAPTVEVVTPQEQGASPDAAPAVPEGSGG